MLIRNPINPYPQNIAISPSNTYLSFTFKGDKLGCYKINIYSYPDEELVYESGYIDFGGNWVYNNETVQFEEVLGELKKKDDSESLAINHNKTYTWEVIMFPEFPPDDLNDVSFPSLGTTSLRYFFQTKPIPRIIPYPKYDELISGGFKINDEIKEYEEILSSVNIECFATSRNLNIEAYYDYGDIKYYYFELFDEDNNLIDKTNKIFSTNIKYNFTGLLNSKKYTLYFHSVSQSEQIFSAIFKISVDYSSKTDINNPPILTCNDNEGNVEIKWIKDSTAIGKATGEYDILKDTGEVDIKTGTIVYDNISSLPIIMNKNNFSLGIKTTIDNNTTKILDYINNDILYELYIENYKIYLRYGDIGSINKTIKECGQIKGNIEFGIQDYEVAKNDTGYMWYDNEDFTSDSTYLLTSVNEETKVNIILKRFNENVECEIKI